MAELREKAAQVRANTPKVPKVATEKEVEARTIEPPNSVTDAGKKDRIRASMEKDGWQGPPSRLCKKLNSTCCSRT